MTTETPTLQKSDLDAQISKYMTNKNKKEKQNKTVELFNRQTNQLTLTKAKLKKQRKFFEVGKHRKKKLKNMNVIPEEDERDSDDPDRNSQHK